MSWQKIMKWLATFLLGCLALITIVIALSAVVGF